MPASLHPLRSALHRLEELFCSPGASLQLPQHSHEELCYVISGAGVWQVGAKTLKIVAGDILLISRCSPRIVRAVSSVGLTMGVISLPPHDEPPAPEDPADTADHGVRVWRHRRLSAELSQIIRDCLAEKARQQLGWVDYVESQIRLFLVKFHRFTHMQVQSRVPLPQGFCEGELRRRVGGYIAQLDLQSGDPDTLETTAEKLAISPRRFTSLFREITGMSRLEYIHDLRLHRAKEFLLARTDTSIETAAYQAGFQDLTTFYRVFKNRESMTPGEWRTLRLCAQNEQTHCRNRH